MICSLLIKSREGLGLLVYAEEFYLRGGDWWVKFLRNLLKIINLCLNSVDRFRIHFDVFHAKGGWQEVMWRLCWVWWGGCHSIHNHEKKWTDVWKTGRRESLWRPRRSIANLAWAWWGGTFGLAQAHPSYHPLQQEARSQKQPVEEMQTVSINKFCFIATMKRF